jgi:LysR family cys regulon transcriptional activator
MELIQLLSFYQIVKTESFSEASRKVFRTQSAISHQIKNLENELKIKLFKRLGKKIKLTEEGELLFDLVDKFSNDLENLKRIYTDMQCGQVGNLTIVSTRSPMTYLLPKITKKFLGQFPKVNFKMITSSFVSEMMPLIVEGDVDFGISLKSEEVLSQKIGFLSWRFFDTILITSKNHPLTRRKTIKLVDIAAYPHVLYGKGSILRKIIDEVYARNNLVYELIIEVDVPENAKSFVEMGIGVGILSSISVTHKDKKRVAIFNVSNMFGKIELGIYYRKDAYMSTAMKNFLELMCPERNLS